MIVLGAYLGAFPRWLHERYPLVKDRIFECEQEGGDLMYVPTDWMHGVANVQDSIGIAVEIGINKQLLPTLLSTLPSS